jgi:formylglycine-generating enzyme required for sulfatase activity
MRFVSIMFFLSGTFAPQALAQAACVAANDSPIQLESAEAVVGNLENLTKIKKGTFETEDEFQERVSQSVLSLNLDRHIVIGPVDVSYGVKYDFEREMLLIPGRYIQYDTGPTEGFDVGLSSKDLGSYQAQNSYGAQTTVTSRELYAYRIRGASKPEKDGKDGARWLDSVEVDEPLIEGEVFMRKAQYVGIRMDRDRARELETKLNIAFVYKPREPFYGEVNWNHTDPTLASPFRTSYYTGTLYGDVSCALVIDDKGKKLATLLMSGTPLTAEAEMAARHKAAIASLQTALIDRGYEPGNTDGEISEATVGAIEAFSAASGYSLVAVDLKVIDAAPIEALSLAVLESPVFHPKLGQIFSDCPGCPSMVVVPAGSFVMGSPETEVGRRKYEGPQRTVTIGSPFAVGRFEVTSDEWGACVADGGCDRDVPKEGYSSYGDTSKKPMVNVTWGDAQAYVSWLTRKTGQPYRLLSEAEWEYAARAGTTTPFSFGSTISTSQANYNNYYTYGTGVKGEYRPKETTEVGSFPPNAWRLYEMHGNASEWTQDCWNKNYRRAPNDGSAWTTGDCSMRVIRGGMWDSDPELIRSAHRGYSGASDRIRSIAFRVARTISAEEEQAEAEAKIAAGVTLDLTAPQVAPVLEAQDPLRSEVLGATFLPFDEAMHSIHGLHKSIPGLIIAEIDVGGIIDKGGLQRGMVLLEVNSQPVTDMATLQKSIGSSKRNKVLIAVRIGQVTQYRTLNLGKRK